MLNPINLFKWLFSDPEDEFDEDNIQLNIDKRFVSKPCAGSLEVDGYCRGCKFEKEHTE